jgi:hypothetical protein
MKSKNPVILNRRFGIKMYKLCNRSGYTYNMRMYLGKQRNVASTDVTPTHRTVVELVWKDEAGHKIFMSITSPP